MFGLAIPYGISVLYRLFPEASLPVVLFFFIPDPGGEANLEML